MLHGSVILLLPTQVPPFVSLTATLLVLIRVPSPHVLVQASVLQLPHSQSMATAKFKVFDVEYEIIFDAYFNYLDNKYNTINNIDLRLQFLQDFLQWLRTTCFLHQGLSWLLHTGIACQ